MQIDSKDDSAATDTAHSARQDPATDEPEANADGDDRSGALDQAI